MMALKRWIALLPAVVVVFAALTGCKTGLKHSSCGQTRHSPGCLESKDACETETCSTRPGKKSACSKIPAAGCKTSCGKSRRCNSVWEYLMSCKSGCEPKCGSQPACGSKCGCKTECAPKCKSRDSCARTQCVIQPNVSGKPDDGTIASGQTMPAQEAIPHGKPIEETPLPGGPNPFEEADPAEAQQPRLPGPPPGPEAARQTENPFVRVAQTQEWDESATVPAAHVPQAASYPEMENAPTFTEAQLRSRDHYSPAWADALGLPSHRE